MDDTFATGFDAMIGVLAESDVRLESSVAAATLYPLAHSWYIGANIPGKPRVFTSYVGGVHAHKSRCDAIARNGYEGFTMTRA